MRISAALKQYLIAKGWVAANATDDICRQAVSTHLLSGELDAAKLHELSQDPSNGAGNGAGNSTGNGAGAGNSAIKSLIAAAIAEAVAPLAQTINQIKAAQPSPNPAPAPSPTPPAQAPAPTPAPVPPQTPVPAGQTTPENPAFDKQVRAVLAGMGIAPPDGSETVSPTRLLSRAAQAGWLSATQVRVKGPLEDYDSSRTAAAWPSDSKHAGLRGKRATLPSAKGPGMGKPLDHASRADEAVCGAYFKWALACNSPGQQLPPGLRLTDHDLEIVKHAMHEMAWTGVLGGENGEAIDGRKLSEFQRKTLLDDSVSGGIYAAPLVLDEQIILTPILYGELFPLVEVININQGRRIEAFTMGRPTFTSGIAEGTAIPLFDTTNFISALDTTIQNAVGSMEIGNDFEEDSPANIGQMVIAAYGEAALQWLDLVVALGDGLTQPKGIFNTAGVTVVHSVSGAAGPVQVGDLEGAMFGVNKAFRTSKGGRNVFIGNETTYRRFRAIPTGSAYNTRAFGQDYGSYELLGFPYKIQPNIGNNQLAFANMAYYRMYRRLGVNVRVEQAGKELALKNQTLIVVRMRYGGQMTLGGAAAVETDLQT